MASPAFDRIEVKNHDGSVTRMTKDTFLALPLTQRVSHILKGDLTFFSGQVLVPAVQALRELNGATARP
jgi:hypothetical protein